MISLPVLIAAASEKTSLADALPHLMGFLVVLLTLTALWGICAITGKVINSSFPTPEAPAASSTSARQAAPPVAQDSDAIPPEVLALIAAAVHASVGRARRIVSVQPHNPAWHQAGRQQIHQSHNIR